MFLDKIFNSKNHHSIVENHRVVDLKGLTKVYGGGELVNLIVPCDEADELLSYAKKLRAIQLSERSLCDLQLFALGAFSPLHVFMNRTDYKCVLKTMR